MKHLISLLLLVYVLLNAAATVAQPVIYNDTTTLITGIWDEQGTVTEIDFSVTSNASTGTGTLYLDALTLVDLPITTTPTSAATWQRLRKMHRGLNLSNWLEAYWLIPFNAFPETNRYTASSVANFRALGIDALRLPVTFENLASTSPPYTLNTNHPAFALLDAAIGWAADNDVQLLIDMHHGQGLTDANFQAQLPRLRAIWRQVIDRYGDLDPERYLFEIYNEPANISNANWRTVAEALVAEIRDAGATHSIVVGATGYNSAGDLLNFPPLDDPDIIYTFHFYDPFLFTHQGLSWTNPPFFPIRPFPTGADIADVTARINAAAEWAAYYDVPLFAGEFGVSSAAPAADRCTWVSTIVGLFEAHDLPWFYWGAIDQSDGFGFFTNGVISEQTLIPCFGEALGLPAEVVAVAEPATGQEAWRVYPNPTQGGVYLRSPVAGALDVVLFNALGEVVYRQPQQLLTANEAWYGELPAVPAGIYWLQLSRGQEVVHRAKVVVQ
jgi:endoglucanase